MTPASVSAEPRIHMIIWTVAVVILISSCDVIIVDARPITRKNDINNIAPTVLINQRNRDEFTSVLPLYTSKRNLTLEPKLLIKVLHMDHAIKF